MTDAEHAAAIRRATEALNRALGDASLAGLHCEIRDLDVTEIGMREPVRMVEVVVERRQRL